MHFLTISSLLGLACAAALPSLTIDPSAITYNQTLVARSAEDRNQCGDSLFIDKTSDGSPSRDDCGVIIFALRYGQNQAGQPIPEYFTVNLPEVGRPYAQLVSYGSCAFGVRRAFNGPSTTTNVGRDDIADLIQSSVEKFGRNGRVGAEGAMYCRYGNEGVAWAVYRT